MTTAPDALGVVVSPFHQVSSDSDAQWENYGENRRESVSEIQGRAVKFLEWLNRR
jgi:hypothetical protein